MSDKKKVTIARILPKFKGMYNSRLGVIENLDPDRYRTVCIYIVKKSEKNNCFQENGIKTYYITKGNRLKQFNLTVLYKLVKILKKENVDILHCHKHKSTFYGILASFFIRRCVVISHVHGIGRTRNWNRKIQNFLMLRRVDKILTVGEATAREVRKTNYSIRPEKICSIGNSIDVQRFSNISIKKENAKRRLNLPENSIVIGTVSRLTPIKGQNYLIEAFSNVKNKLKNAQLVIVGDGRAKLDLEKQVEKLAMQESVHFLGYRADISEVLRSFDIFVLPSVGEEGLPKAMLEALAAGVPVIGTSISGIPEILENGKCGRLVPPGDSEQLEEAILEMMAMNTRDCNDLIAAAKRRTKNLYNHQTVSRKLMRIYEEELGK